MAGSNESANYVAGSLRRTWRNAGDPVNGASGTYAGVASPGDLLIDSSGMHVFINSNTMASPTWSMLRASGPVTSKGASAYLTAGEATAAFTKGTVIYTLAAEATNLDGAAKKTCGARYDTLEVVCDGSAWNIIGKIGTWS